MKVVTNPANLNLCSGIPLPNFIVTEFVEPTRKVEKWIPGPWGKFIDLEEKDEIWARPLGLGKIEVHEEPVFYMFASDPYKLVNPYVGMIKSNFC